MLLNFINTSKLLFQYSMLFVLCIVSCYNVTAQQCGEITCTNYVNNAGFPASEWAGTQWSLSGLVQEYGGYSNIPALMVAVVDDSCQVWRTPGINLMNGDTINGDHCYGQFNGAPLICAGATAWRTRSEAFFIFQTNNPAQMDSLVSMLTNKIPVNHSVLIYTYVPYNNQMSIYDNWSTDLYNHFSDLGSDSIAPGKPNNGFVSFYIQGDTTSYQEVYGAPIDSIAVQLLTFTTVIPVCQRSLLSVADTSFCSGLSFVINAISGYDDYLWSTGDSTQSISVNQDTTYYLIASQNLGCEMVDSVQVMLLNCTGIKGNEQIDVLIYPNPINKNFVIWSKDLIGQKAEISIFSIEGKRLFYEKRHFTTVDENVKVNLPNGLYQLVISNQKSHYSQKILIN